MKDYTSLLSAVLKDGGGTYSTSNMLPIVCWTGYLVSSGTVPEVRVNRGSGNVLSEFTVAMENVRDIIESNNREYDWYVGVWIDGEDIVIDASELIIGLERAFITAKDRKQDAIYRCRDGQVLPV